jgi:hypothetical protein
MDIIVRHRKIIKDTDLPENDKNKIQKNLEEMENIWKGVEIYQQECEKVEEYNQKIDLEEENSSMELMTPSIEATSGIKQGEIKIKKLIDENMNIIRGRTDKLETSNQTFTSYNLSKDTITLIILNILLWGIVLYLVFFGPTLRLF